MGKKVKLIIVGIMLSFLMINSYANTKDQPIDPLNKLLQEAVQEGAFPGGCLEAGNAKQILLDRCFGYFTYAGKIPDQNNSIFDLASLTKVIATTSAIMKLYDQNKIKLSDKVIQYLPNFAGPSPEQTKLKSQITILQLLTHTSGLPADNYSVLKYNTLQQIWQGILDTPVLNYPGTVYRYSDLNFILLGQIVQKISGVPLNQFVEQSIFKPLGMTHTFYNPPQKDSILIVPTSYDAKQDALFKGIVDDPMARALGGVSGNAGLFSTVHDLGIFAQMMLNRGEYKGVRIFKASTVDLFTQRADVIPLNSRALGWDTVYNPQSILPMPDRAASGNFANPAYYEAPGQFTAGFYIDPNAYGHTGYTGTSIWISQKYGIYVILLTNRVCPFAKDFPEKYFRQQINSAAWQSLGFTKKNLTYIEPKSTEKVCK